MTDLSGGKQVKNTADRIVLILAALSALAIAIIYLLNWRAALSSPFSIAFEGPMLWTARALASGQNIYSAGSLSHEPWLVTIYPPLYPLFAAFVVKIFGVSYFPLRIANMFFSVALAYLLYRILQASGSRPSSCLFGLVFLFSFDIMSQQSFAARPDYLQLLLSAFTLERFVNIYNKTAAELSMKSLTPVLLLALAAIFAKQQAIVFVVSIVLFLLSIKAAKLAIKFAALWLLGVVLVSAGIQAITGGYLSHLTILAATKSSSKVLISNLAGLGLDWIKVFWALPVVPIGILAIKSLTGLKKLPFILVTVSTLLFLYSMGIPASNTNHLMSALFALSWCIAICLDHLPSWVGLIGLLCCGVSFLHLGDEARYRPQLLPFALKSAEELQKLDLKAKPVLTDDVNLNIMTDSTPVLVDCATFLNVWSAQGSDFASLIKPLSEKRYAAVIINSVDGQMSESPIWWPKAVVAAVRKSYHKTGELNCSGWTMDVYLPDASEQAPSSIHN